MVRKKTNKRQRPDMGMGGFMPNPPEDCMLKGNWQFLNGRKYIDNVLCKMKCKGCDRRKEHDAEWKEFLKKDEN